MLKITKQSITLTKGDDASIQLIPRYKDKTAYVFLEGDRGVFRLKTGNTLIEKECDIYQDPNKMVVSFQPADTINLKPGIYRYEVELITIYGFHYTFIADQTFIIGNEYEQRLQASGSNGSGNAGSNLPEIDGELTEDPVVSGEIQPTNPSVDYNNLTNKPKLNGVQIAGNHDNAYYGIPTELADLTADADHRTVSDTEKETWNAKSDFSGSYDDLTDVPEDLVEDASYVHTDNNYTSEEKTKLGDIEDGAEANVQADWNETDTSSDAYIQNKPTIPAAQVNSDWNASSGVAEILHKPTLGTAAAKDYTGSVLENSTDLVESGAVKTAIDNAISSVYKPAGNKACAELVSALLIAANLGNVYNMTDDGVTTADFVEGAGKAIEAGDNVVIVDIGSSVYKFDLLSGMVDLSNYVQKSSTAGLIKNDGTIDQTAYAKQNEMSVSINGDQTTIQLKNGTTATVINAHQDISGKANKSEMTVTPGTGSDADKTTIQLKSGTDATVLTQHQDISGKVDKEQGKGLSTNDYTTVEKEKLAAISTEANKVTASETNGNIQIDGTETTVYDDTELQGAVSDLEDDVEEIQGELTTETATIEGNPLNFSTKSAQKSKSTILSLEPIQDLHGYDKPWTGGAEKNLLPLTKEQIYAGSQSDVQSGATWNSKHTVMNYRGITWSLILDSDDNVIGIKVNGTSTGRSVLRIANRTDSSAWHYNGGYYVTKGNTSEDANKIEFRGNYYDGTDVKVLFAVVSEDFGYFSLNSISYNVGLWLEIPSADISVSDVFIYPMIRLTSETDSSFVPYTNKCSIIGRTEMNILGCGKNIFDKDHLGTNQNRYLNAIGDEMTPGGAAIWRYSDYIKVTPSATYILKGYQTMGTSAPSYCFYDKYKNFVAGYTYGQSLNKTLTIPSNVHYVRFSVEYNSLDTCQLEKDNQSTEYESYTNSNDLTISLGQTVYGGTLDVEKGELTIVEKCELFPSMFLASNSPRRFLADLNSSNINVDLNKRLECKTNLLEMVENATHDFGTFYVSGSNYFVVPDQNSRFANATEVNAFMVSNSAMLCYPLATPITINLTPNVISLLEGVNNISTTADGIKLTYRDGSVATLGDLKSAVDDLQDEIDNPIAYDGKTYRLGMDATGLYLYNITDDTKAYIQMVSE